MCRVAFADVTYRSHTIAAARFFVTFSNETVKALVGCMGFTIFLAVTIGVA